MRLHEPPCPVHPFTRWRLALLVALACAGVPGDAEGQRADTARAAAARPSIPRPPLSPRRAFLTSLVAPGYAQSVLGRPNAAALFILTEAIGILMVRESSIALQQARRLEADSIPVAFVDQTTGAVDTTFAPGRYTSALVRARRSHLEDWIAALIANHIIAAADAFVAAHLWDVPLRVGFEASDGRRAASVRFRW